MPRKIQELLLCSFFSSFFILTFFTSNKGYGQATNLVITQVYGAGGNSGATYLNDFIEIFNPTGSTVSLTGWSVQYASATGTSWSVTPLTGSIAPGKYYLVQEAGGANGVALPTPDATGSIAMAAGAGKVLLSNTTTAFTPTSCPTGGSVIDFVGYGATANCFEGTGPTPAPTTTNSVKRTVSCNDINQNATEFTAVAVLNSPRNNSTPATPCLTVPTQFMVTSITPSSPTSGSTFSVTVQSVDGSNAPGNVTLLTGFTLSTNGNAGTIGGTTSGSIISGSSLIVVTGVTLSGAGTGVTITATQSSGDPLTPGTSNSFNVLPATPQAIAATNPAINGFDANWNAASGASGYRLDVASAPFPVNATDLFISEYVEGSSSNKYIEIFNGTGVTVNLSDYRLRLYANGSSSPTNDVVLSGTLANGSTIVYSNLSATVYAGATTSNAAVNFNGDDAIALFKISTASNVDIIGRIGEDPGTEWTSAGGYSTLDKTLVRKSSVTGGVTINPVAGFPTLGTEWDVYSIDDVSHLGAHAIPTIPTYVPGYQNLFVAGTTQPVSGLIPNHTYYYRVRSEAVSGVSGNSNIISITTLCPLVAASITGTLTFCAGTSTILDAGVFNSYSWSTGATTQTITVNTAQTFTVTVSDINGCTGSASANTTFGGGPNPAISGTLTFCTGNSTTLDAGAYTFYSWSNGATSQLTVVNTSGTYTVTVTDGNGCTASTSATVSAVNLPTVSFSGLPASICFNAPSVTLTGNQAPAGSFSGSGITDNLDGTASFDPSSAGVGGPYNITYSYTDIGTGCSNSQTLAVTVNDAPNIAAIAPVSNTCPVASFDLSTIILSNSGASGTIAYFANISDANGNVNSISPTVNTSGTYFIRITAGQGCFDVEPVFVTIISCGCANPPTANAGINFSVCAGSNAQLNGSIGGDATSATWSGGGGTFSPDANTVNAIYTPSSAEVTAGTVTLTLTTDDPDGNGPCVAAFSSVTITINALPNVVVSPPSLFICSGTTSGNITASGADSFSWLPADGSLSSTSGSTVTANPSSTTTYTVTGTGSNGCQNTATITVTVNALPVVTVTPNLTAICTGSSSGVISAGGAVSYSWAAAAGLSSTTGALVTANPASSTTYTVTGTDANGCTAAASLVVSVNPLPSVTITGNSNVCSGSASVLDAGNGFSSYLWSSGETTQTASESTAGIYVVTVSDVNGCTNTASKTLTVTNPPVLTATATPSSCNNVAPGTIDLNASGGAPCNLNSKGLIISKISSNPTGSDSPFEFVELVATKDIDFSITPYTVIFSNNGTANANGWIAGGALTYAFQINTGTAVAGGVYYVGGDQMPPLTNRLRVINTATTAGDGGIGNTGSGGVLGNGGANADGVAVFNFPVGSITSSTVPVDAVFFGNTAIGGAVVSGGTQGYQLPVNDHYSGGKLQSSSFFIPSDILAASDRLVVATGIYDVVNNVFTASRTYANNSLLLFVSGSSSVSLVNAQPYSYSWSNGAATEDLSGLAAGTYTVTVTDCNGCSSTISKTVVNTPNPAPVILGNLSFCLGASSNLATSVVFSSYIWSNGVTTRVNNVNTAGTFTVTVTDANGCTGSASVTTTPVFCCNIIMSGITNPVICNGGNNGSIDVTSSNTSGSPAYLWDNGATTEDRSGLPAGTYTVTVTYGSGCSQTQIFNITQPAAILPSGIVVNVSCRGTSTGSISLSPTGGSSPYTFLWNNGSTTQNRTSLNPGTYIVTVTDANLCQVSASYTVTQPATSLIINTNKVNVRCSGSLTGSITAAAAGGVSPYSYSWNTVPVQTTASVTGLAAGVYICSVTDAAGCTKTTVITITQPAPIIVVQSQTNVSFPGGNDGTASVSVSGGTPGYTYSWNTVPVKTTSNVTGLSAGIYKCTISDSKNCLVKVTFTITEPFSKTMNTGDQHADESLNILLSPNPASGIVNIQFDGNENQLFQMQLADLAGRILVNREQFAIEGVNRLTYDFSNLSKGIYFIQIKMGNRQKSLRLVLQ